LSSPYTYAAVDIIISFIPAVGTAKGVYDAYIIVMDPQASGLDKTIAVFGVLPGGKLVKEGRAVFKILGEGEQIVKVERAAAKSTSTLSPGPYARESIPAHRGPPTAEEQRQVNELMRKNGCHTCGTKDPGTRSGNAIADHQPAQALGEPEIFLPHCNTCKARQGGEVVQEIRRRGK
jgi:hypothetical protein